MAKTLIENIIDPEVLADQISAKFPDYLVFANSGLVDVNSTFPLGTPGTTFTIPFWKQIGTFGALVEGTPLDPAAITTGKEKALVMRAGAAWGVYDTAALVSIPDPMSEIASQVGRRAAEYIDAKLVLAAENTPNTYNQSGQETTGYMTQNAVVNGMLTLGDNHGKLLGGGAIIMHSKCYGDLLKLGVIQNQYQFGGNVLQTGVVPTLMGLPIIVSDLVTKATVSSVVYYNSYIVAKGALALFYQRALNVEFDRDVLGKYDIISADVHFAPHLYGWDDATDTQAAESAKSIAAVTIYSK
jgi:hypothetical protein